jgi:ATP adenylyltransferase
MEFLKKEKSTDCIFCTFPKETKDRENLIVYRGKESFIILNKYPYNSGHLMVVPTFHTADYEKVPGSALPISRNGY